MIIDDVKYIQELNVNNRFVLNFRVHFSKYHQ